MMSSLDSLALVPQLLAQHFPNPSKEEVVVFVKSAAVYHQFLMLSLPLKQLPAHVVDELAKLFTQVLQQSPRVALYHMRAAMFQWSFRGEDLLFVTTSRRITTKGI